MSTDAKEIYAGLMNEAQAAARADLVPRLLRARVMAANFAALHTAGEVAENTAGFGATMNVVFKMFAKEESVFGSTGPACTQLMGTVIAGFIEDIARDYSSEFDQLWSEERVRRDDIERRNHPEAIIPPTIED